MSDWKGRLNTWLISRTQRERWMVYLVAFVSIVALTDTIFVTPTHKRLSSTNAQVEAELESADTLRVEVARFTEQLSRDPNKVLRERIERIRQQHAEVDDALRELTVGLIQPAEMTRVLREMLADEKGLRLVRLANGPSEAIALDAPVAENTKEEAASTRGSGPRLYRHTLELEVEGGYLDALRYVKRLEALEWTFYWEGLELNVERYPNARVVIRVSTLGLREGWVGV